MVIFKIVWEKEVSLPECVEEVTLNRIDNMLIYTCGFCASWQKHAKIRKNKTHKYSRGFKNSTYMIQLDEIDEWYKLPDFPGLPRQGTKSVIIDNSMYCYGGFSYEPNKNPKIKSSVRKTNYQTFEDGYKLTYDKDKETFHWEDLPDLPIKLSNFAFFVKDRKMYICCGANTYEQYNFMLDVEYEIEDEKIIIGEDVYCYDLDDVNKGWYIVSRFPGTLRINPSCNIIGDYVYIIGGIYPIPGWSGDKINRFYSVTDNWKYDIKNNIWIRLSNNNLHITNFGSDVESVFMDRFIILIGGVMYWNTINMDEVSSSIHPEGLKIPDGDPFIFCDTIIVYDTHIDKFTLADKLFCNVSKPCYTVVGNKIYLISGETYNSMFTFQSESYAHHLDLFAIGTIFCDI
jgi:N-acetylneuraminic acid mutarotase